MWLVEKFRNWRERAGRLFIAQAAIVILAVVAAIPIGIATRDRMQEVRQEARMRFIITHRLWELHPEFKGSPETWTSFAARLLTDRQLMVRVNSKYGALAEQIQIEYHRDLTIAQSVVVFRALAVWALPLLTLYGVVWLLYRRQRPRPQAPAPVASLNDPRYLPTQPSDDRPAKS